MDLFSRAQALHQQGQLPDAARLYQQFLAIEPGHFGALNLYAIAATQLGQIEEAGVRCAAQSKSTAPRRCRTTITVPSCVNLAASMTRLRASTGRSRSIRIDRQPE